MFSQELHEVVSLVKRAAIILLEARDDGLEVRTKSDGTSVTQADIKADRLIVDGLSDAFPQDGIISEEASRRVHKQVTWYVDPLDGTSGYIAGEDEFCIAVGRADDRPLFGLIHFPVTGSWYWGQYGRGAFVHDGSRAQRLVLEDSDQRITANPARGHGLGFPGGERRTVRNVVRILDGELDGYVNRAVWSWDLCAPLAILMAAGGDARCFSGRRLVLSPEQTPEVAIGTPAAVRRVCDQASMLSPER